MNSKTKPICISTQMQTILQWSHMKHEVKGELLALPPLGGTAVTSSCYNSILRVYRTAPPTNPTFPLVSITWPSCSGWLRPSIRSGGGRKSWFINVTDGGMVGKTLWHLQFPTLDALHGPEISSALSPGAPDWGRSRNFKQTGSRPGVPSVFGHRSAFSQPPESY